MVSKNAQPQSGNTQPQWTQEESHGLRTVQVGSSRHSPIKEHLRELKASVAEMGSNDIDVMDDKRGQKAERDDSCRMDSHLADGITSEQNVPLLS